MMLLLLEAAWSEWLLPAHWVVLSLNLLFKVKYTWQYGAMLVFLCLLVIFCSHFWHWYRASTCSAWEGLLSFHLPSFSINFCELLFLLPALNYPSIKRNFSTYILIIKSYVIVCAFIEKGYPSRHTFIQFHFERFSNFLSDSSV